MSESKHTPGPWARVYGGIESATSAVFVCAPPNMNDADHIVACVNGCDGLNPAAYRDVVAVLQKVADFGENTGVLTIGHTAALAELGRNARSALAAATGGSE